MKKANNKRGFDLIRWRGGESEALPVPVPNEASSAVSIDPTGPDIFSRKTCFTAIPSDNVPPLQITLKDVDDHNTLDKVSENWVIHSRNLFQKILTNSRTRRMRATPPPQ